MTRERFLDPEVCKSEQVARLTDPWAKLLWDRIIVTADDEGRRKASGHSLKADCFPCDPGISIEQVEVCRDAIAEVGLIRLYKDEDGSPILDMEKWRHYQKLKYTKSSRYPDFPGSGEIRQNPAEPAGIRPDLDVDVGSGPGRSPGAESVTGCGVEGSGEEGWGGDAVDSAPRRGVAESDGEESASAAEPVPAPALPAAEAPEGDAVDEGHKAKAKATDALNWQEIKAWLGVFEKQTSAWNGDGTAARRTARQRIELGYTAAQTVLAHVHELTRSKTKSPWPLLAKRLTLSRCPSDRALVHAAILLRAPIDPEGPGPPWGLTGAFSLDAEEKRKKGK